MWFENSAQRKRNEKNKCAKKLQTEKAHHRP